MSGNVQMFVIRDIEIVKNLSYTSRKDLKYPPTSVGGIARVSIPPTAVGGSFRSFLPPSLDR
jgi:hypothetical protein